MLERREMKGWGMEGCSLLGKFNPVHVQAFTEMFVEENNYSAESG